ncbi:hypothetical protein LTR56_007794 [Elasticomyces elasticus]|nr:hypothetical protein LTR56_007794 [Elasticomyces elasticus]KAK3667843.1 hypothetical protein LTR22_001288 [Elasticomyces elasticus]KAK4932164.1 hypothetical protein LTR49_001461 [Elasticomyces elasticus]KAK5763456.1 hypothetical protein LTS12_006427 [Elasticomyces elasticus]
MTYYIYGSEITQRRIGSISICNTTSNKKIRQAQLKVCGIKFDPGCTLKRLEALWLRFTRGLLPYTTCSNSELRRFCQQRGLKAIEGAMRESLISVLENADDEPVFERFLDLPPELRAIIFEYAEYEEEEEEESEESEESDDD